MPAAFKVLDAVIQVTMNNFTKMTLNFKAGFILMGRGVQDLVNAMGDNAAFSAMVGPLQDVNTAIIQNFGTMKGLVQQNEDLKKSNKDLAAGIVDEWTLVKETLNSLDPANISSLFPDSATVLVELGTYFDNISAFMQEKFITMKESGFLVLPMPTMGSGDDVDPDASPSDQLAARFEMITAGINAGYETIKQAYMDGTTAITQILADGAAAQAKIDKDKHDSAVKASSQFFGNLVSLMGTKSRKLFEIGKAAAIAESIVNSYKAATDALADSTLGGMGARIAVSASVLAKGLASVASIQGTSFGGGGGGGGAGSVGSVPSSPETNNRQEATNVEVTIGFDSNMDELARVLAPRISEQIVDGSPVNEASTI